MLQFIFQYFNGVTGNAVGFVCLAVIIIIATIGTHELQTGLRELLGTSSQSNIQKESPRAPTSICVSTQGEISP